MRLVTWNCAMGLPHKLAALRSLHPDIAVVSEVACAERLRRKVPDLRDVPIVWVGDNPNKGLAVLSFTGCELDLDHSYRSTNQFIAPIHVKGPKPFRLLAVWDHNDRQEVLNKRPGPLLRALNDSSEFCQDHHLVVAGDFNNNPQWDRPNGPNNMLRISEELLKRGLVSLYHKKHALPFGREPHATYWQYRNQAKPYHIDYIFVPPTWAENLNSFEIGEFDEWCKTGLSDHAPLIADFR